MQVPPNQSTSPGLGGGIMNVLRTGQWQNGGKPLGLLENPTFNVGMGLLSSGYDASINPFQAALGGLASAKTTQQDNAERERKEQLRRKLAELIKSQSGGRANDMQAQQAADSILSNTPANSNPAAQQRSQNVKRLFGM